MSPETSVRILPAGIIFHVDVGGWNPGRVNTGHHHIVHVDSSGLAAIRTSEERLDAAEEQLVDLGILERRQVEPGCDPELAITDAAFEALDGHLRLEGRGWRAWPTRAIVPYPTFPTVESFHADVPARERSPEVDYGVMWMDGSSAWPRYRVSWVEATGEVYAICLGPSRRVEVLGLARTRDEVEARLAGWADREDWPSQLSWVRERLATSAAEAKIR